MSIGSSIVSALAGGLLTLGALTVFHPASEVYDAISTATGTSSGSQPIAKITRKADLRTTLRRLYEERLTYWRSGVLSVLANGGDIDAITARLMKNQEEIASVLKQYYGEANGAKLTPLLKDQVNLGIATVKAAKAGDKAKLAAAQKKWEENGAAIVALLGSANPFWAKSTMADTMKKQAEATVRQVSARLNKDWPGDIRATDDTHRQSLALADTLTDGIIRQFPGKFSG